MPSTWWAAKTIHMTQPTSSGMQQTFQSGCRQVMNSGSRIELESGSVLVNENVTAYTSGTVTLPAVSGTFLLSSTKNANFQLPQPVKGLDMTIRMESTFVTFLESTIAGVFIGATTSDDVIKFTTQSAAGSGTYGRNCRLIARSSARWDLIAPTTLQVTLSSST